MCWCSSESLTEVSEQIQQHVLMFLILEAGLEVAPSPACDSIEKRHTVSVDREWVIRIGEVQGSGCRSHLSLLTGGWASNTEVKANEFREFKSLVDRNPVEKNQQSVCPAPFEVVRQ
eukprot:781841-Rhodomonas_salina.2